MPVRVVTDSTSYVPTDERERLGIKVVTLFVNFGQESFAEEGLDNEWFYQRMASGSELPTSSQPSVQSMVDVFTEAVEAGEDVCGVFISADMSGTLESARMAVEMVRETHPDARIELVDSRSNSMQLGLAVLQAARAAAAGASLDEVAAAARATIPRTRFLFVPHTLEHLRKGGRIGGASALLGSLLQIRPILTVTGGTTNVWGKVRTKKRALAEMVSVLAADMESSGLAEVFVHHINAEAEGREFATMVEEATGQAPRIVGIGPVVGLHVGPGTLAIAYRAERDLPSAAAAS
ncbi:MAG: DegV family protein [Clostridiales bacterium]|nr:DegV family protein [Clostridiales bacterium]